MSHLLILWLSLVVVPLHAEDAMPPDPRPARVRAAGRLPEMIAAAHVAAADEAAAASGVPAGVLLAVAKEESHFNPSWVSRVTCDASGCARRIGLWPGSARPPGSRGPYFCGYHQMRAETWEDCRRLRGQVLPDQYAAAAAHLRLWMAGARCRRFAGPARLRCALRGYGGTPDGNHAYAARVLRVAGALEAPGA